jgi:hypothetical protein
MDRQWIEAHIFLNNYFKFKRRQPEILLLNSVLRYVTTHFSKCCFNSYIPDSQVAARLQGVFYKQGTVGTSCFVAAQFQTVFVSLQPSKQQNKQTNSVALVRLSARLVPTFADRGCHVISVTDPYGRILRKYIIVVFKEVLY